MEDVVGIASHNCIAPYVGKQTGDAKNRKRARGRRYRTVIRSDASVALGASPSQVPGRCGANASSDAGEGREPQPRRAALSKRPAISQNANSVRARPAPAIAAPADARRADTRQINAVTLQEPDYRSG